MKKWYQWFFLSIILGFCGVLNYLDGKSIIAAIIQVPVTAILGIAQFICQKKGEAGKKAFGYISSAAIALLIGTMIYLVLRTMW